MPNLRVLSPADHLASAGLVDFSLKTNGVKYLRLDAQAVPCVYSEESALELQNNGFEHKGSGKVCLDSNRLHVAYRIKNSGLFI